MHGWSTSFSFKNGWSLFCFYIYEIYTYPSFQNTPPPSDEPLTKAKRHRPPPMPSWEVAPKYYFSGGIIMANYYNNYGKKTGYSSKGLFGTTNYYGSDGRKKGYSSQGLFGTTNYYGSDGRKKGYSSNGSFGTRNYYDSSGRKTGYSSKGLFGTINYYDASGKKKGYKSKSWW